MSTSISTVGEIQAEFVVRQNSATTIAYYTDTVIKSWIDQAHKFAAGYKKWPMTSARAATTYASLVLDEEGLLSGQYPEAWKLNSIRFLRIGGKRYEKKSFFSFLKFLEDKPSASDEIYTDYGRLYYVNAGANGSGTISIWGQYIPALDTTDPNAATIFSGVDVNGNLAMVELMQSYAMTREKKESEAKVHFEKALSLLEAAWKLFEDDNFVKQEANTDGMFSRIDVVGGRTRDDFNSDQFPG